MDNDAHNTTRRPEKNISQDWIETPLTAPDECSQSCSDFLHEHVSYIQFVDHVFTTTEFADNALIAIQAQGAKQRQADPGGCAESSARFSNVTKLFLPLMSEMLWCRGVDNFLTYVSKMLGLVFRTRPETLRSAKMERLDTVLSFPSMESLIDHLAEKRVHDLAYMGLDALNDTLLKEIGFALFEDEGCKKRAITIVEHRNLVVHNRSVINDLYINRTGDDSIPAGHRLQVGLPCTSRCMRFLAAAVLDIDKRTQVKFSLEHKALCQSVKRCLGEADNASEATWRRVGHPDSVGPLNETLGASA